MESKPITCPDCQGDGGLVLGRRDFLVTVGAAAATASLPLWATPRAQAAPSPKSAAETAVKGLYDTLTDEQRKEICFDWDYTEKRRGLLRTFVSNNWQITRHPINGNFYTKKQQDIIGDIFKGSINPDWYARFLKHLKDDTGGRPWGSAQSIAIFGKPGEGKFEFVMTGRHMTIRADGNTESHVAFGGPIFYGHQASSVQGLTEKKGHPGNVFWPQAEHANKIYHMLEPKQQKQALLAMSPAEAAVDFHKAKQNFPGVPVADLATEHQKELQKLLAELVEPFRTEDRDEALACLKKQGGLTKCSLAFYKDQTLTEGVWDNWRLEGPAFVWYFRGHPHVHVWVNVADEASVKLNARG